MEANLEKVFLSGENSGSESPFVMFPQRMSLDHIPSKFDVTYVKIPTKI